MNATTLTRTISALLLATAALHVLTAVFGAPAAMKLPLIAFGLIYGALGLWVQTGGRTAVLTTALVTLIALILGGIQFLREPSAPVAMMVMFLIDVAVIAAGAMYLLKVKAS